MSIASGEQAAGSIRAPRLVSLDVFRGVTIAFMILVGNRIGDYYYWPLDHAPWNGYTPTDLIFPAFLFIVGITVVFSSESRLSRGDSKASLLLHTLRRAAILFLLGLVINGFPYFNLGTLRIYGVLQRIAICFLFASILYLLDRRASSKIVLVVAILLGYWFLMRWVPVPGFGVPGRDIPFLDPTRNLAACLDRHVFPGRLYNTVRDPEGILSTLPALGTTLLGMLTGIWLRSKRDASQKAVGMFACGALGILLGMLWSHWFPINKNLWTSSFVVLTAGWSLVVFSVLYWAVDIRNWKKGWTHIWLVFGTNAITAYVFSHLLSATLYAIHWKKGGVSVSVYQSLSSMFLMKSLSLNFSSLLYALCAIGVCYLPIAWLYHKKIFLKI